MMLVCYFKNWREGAGQGWISCPMLYNDYRYLGETGKDPHLKGSHICGNLNFLQKL